MSNKIARFLATILFSTVLAASVLVKVSAPCESTFQMKYGDNLDIAIETDQYQSDAVIIPGEACTYDPYIKNTGNYDVYVFMEVNLPDETFHLSDINDGWSLIETDSNKQIYAYGSSSSMKVLSKSTNGNETHTPHLTEKITLESDTDIVENNYTVESIGYAISSQGLNKSKPEEVWNMIQSELAKK